MKHTRIILILIFCHFLAQSQNYLCDIQHPTGDSIYNRLLCEHINYLKKNNFDSTLYNKQIIYVLKLSPITDQISKNISGQKIVLLNDEDVEKLSLKSKFHAIWLSPFFIDDEMLKIVYTDIIVSNTGTHMEKLIVGGSFYHYKYNCTTHKFELSNIKRR